MNKTKIVTGFSESGIDDAILNALEKANNPVHYEIIETLATRDPQSTSQYQAILKTLES